MLAYEHPICLGRHLLKAAIKQLQLVGVIWGGTITPRQNNTQSQLCAHMWTNNQCRLEHMTVYMLFNNCG